MHEAARQRSEFIRDLVKPRSVNGCGMSKMPADAMLDEVVLFPSIKRRVELLLKLQLVATRCGVSTGVKEQRLIERPLIERATLGPRVVAMAPQIEVARVLHDNQSLGLVVKVDDR